MTTPPWVEPSAWSSRAAREAGVQRTPARLASFFKRCVTPSSRSRSIQTRNTSRRPPSMAGLGGDRSLEQRVTRIRFHSVANLAAVARTRRVRCPDAGGGRGGMGRRVRRPPIGRGGAGAPHTACAGHRRALLGTGCPTPLAPTPLFESPWLLAGLLALGGRGRVLRGPRAAGGVAGAAGGAAGARGGQRGARAGGDDRPGGGGGGGPRAGRGGSAVSTRRRSMPRCSLRRSCVARRATGGSASPRSRDRVASYAGRGGSVDARRQAARRGSAQGFRGRGIRGRGFDAGLPPRHQPRRGQRPAHAHRLGAGPPPRARGALAGGVDPLARTQPAAAAGRLGLAMNPPDPSLAHETLPPLPPARAPLPQPAPPAPPAPPPRR